MDKADKLKLRKILKKKLSPLGAFSVGLTPYPERYPCEQFKVSMYFHFPWPDGISDKVIPGVQLPSTSEGPNWSITVWPPKVLSESDKEQEVTPWVSTKDADIEFRLAQMGIAGYAYYTWYRADEAPYGLTRPFPPISGDFSEGKDFYREMTEEEVENFQKDYLREPFTDERFILERYSGISMGRIAILPAAAAEKLLAEEGGCLNS